MLRELLFVAITLAVWVIQGSADPCPTPSPACPIPTSKSGTQLQCDEQGRLVIQSLEEFYFAGNFGSIYHCHYTFVGVVAFKNRTVRITVVELDIVEVQSCGNDYLQIEGTVDEFCGPCCANTTNGASGEANCTNGQPSPVDVTVQSSGNATGRYNVSVQAVGTCDTTTTTPRKISTSRRRTSTSRRKTTTSRKKTTTARRRTSTSRKPTTTFPACLLPNCPIPRNSVGKYLELNSKCQFVIPDKQVSYSYCNGVPQNYTDGMYCKYQFVGSKRSDRIQVTLVLIDIEQSPNCINDKLVITGTKPAFGTGGPLCGYDEALQNTTRYAKCPSHGVASPITATFSTVNNGKTGKGYCMAVQVMGWPC